MNMTQHTTQKLGDICRIEKGRTGIASAAPGEYPLVVTAEERKTCNTYQFDCEAVCIPLVSSSGHGKKSLKNVHYQSGKFALGSILCAVIPKNPQEVNARYLHQYLQFYKDTLLVPLMKGAANVSLSMRDIANVEIPLPDFDTQAALAKIFVEVQEKQKQLNAEFEKQTEYASRLRQNILQVALDYLAVGIDPAKAHIFIQSMVPELTELSFYYMNLVTVSRLQRNPTVKAEIQQKNFETSIPVGFFTYPISQAADITAFRATTVPAGEDQMPMLEQCREIVHKFNAVYGETLTEPEILLPSNHACLRLPGIDGKAKMSKSLGNCIYLSDEPEDIKKKIMSMYTDPDHLRVQDPGKVEGNPVFTYLDAFSRPEHFAEFLPEYQNLDELKAHYQRGGLGDVKVKKFLNNVMQSELEPIRTRRKEWEQRLPEVVEILKEGSAVAEKVAAETLADVRKSMKIDYFEDNNLLK